MAKKKKAKKKKATKKKKAKPKAKKKEKKIKYYEKIGLTKNQTYVLGAIAVVIIVGLLYYASITQPTPVDTGPVIQPGDGIQPGAATIVTIIKDSTCGVCNSDNAAKVLRMAFDGVTINEIDSATPEAQELISTLGLKALPAYVFNDAVKTEMNYTQFEGALQTVGDRHYLDERVPGLIVRYFQPPSIADEPTLGPDTAKVTIIEFSDPYCGACRAFHLETKPMLEETYGDDIRLVFKTFPLKEKHMVAINAMMCAHEQDSFWELTDMVFEEQATGPLAMDEFAVELGLNITQFNECRDTLKYESDILDIRTEGTEYGISATPTLFINGIKLTGVPIDEDMRRIIDAELAK